VTSEGALVTNRHLHLHHLFQAAHLFISPLVFPAPSYAQLRAPASSPSPHPSRGASRSLALTTSRSPHLQRPDPEVLRPLQDRNHLEGHQRRRAPQDHGRKSTLPYPFSRKIVFRNIEISDFSLSFTFSEGLRGYGVTADSQTMLEIVDAMDSFGTIRTEPVLVVGGGLVTDVAGYACASYRRSSNFIRVPTTLIGLIDASVSIKGESRSLIAHLAIVNVFEEMQNTLADK
jgi:hypothetical protein